MSIPANTPQTSRFRRPTALAAMLVSLVLVATSCGSSSSANEALSLNGDGVSVDKFEKIYHQANSIIEREIVGADDRSISTCIAHTAFSNTTASTV